MADNNQQWEEFESSDDSPEEYQEEYEDNEASEQEEYDDEQSDEYENEEEYEETDDDASNGGKRGSNLIKIIIALLLLLLLCGGGFFIAKSMSGNKSGTSSEIAVEQAPAVSDNKNQNDEFFENSNDGGQDFMNVSFNENGDTNVNDGQDNGTVATVSETDSQNNDDIFINSTLQGNQANDSIMVSYNQASRLNPFKPPIITAVSEAEKPYVVLDDTQFEIIEPPVSSASDENLKKLLQTQISGILYDTESPSAIINLNGTDYFVKIGDKISGYVIKNITRDKVQVDYKNNTYVASVGQLFTRGVLEQSNVADFEHKFAGRNKNKNN